MRVFALFLLFAMFIATGIPARAEQQWKIDTGQQQVFTAAVYTDDHARMVVSCQTSSYLSPEVSLTIVLPEKADSQVASNRQTIFRTKEKEIQATLTRIGIAGEEAAWRWDAIGSTSLRTIRELADAAEEGPLLVTLPGTKQITFTYGYTNSSAFRDTVLRCAPSVIRARRQASTPNMALPSLLTLEGDANDRCRGGGVDDVWAACAERTEYVEALHSRGMCYGKRDQIGADMAWHHCGPGSIR